MEAGKLNLPERINHPAHGLLVLRVHKEEGFTTFYCSICSNGFSTGDYIYACDTCSDTDCHFMVDIACSSIKGEVRFNGHDHSLLFVERVNPYRSQMCCSCKGSSHELLFTCMEGWCDYTLHLSCGPMPIAIRFNHSGHELILTLMDALLDGADPEDSWCDICEERRDPTKCVYRSEDPPFTATIDCVLPQIVGALKGDHGEIKLRTVRGHVTGTVLGTAQGSTEQESGEEKSVLECDGGDVIVETKIESEAAEVENTVYITFDGKFLFDSLPPEDLELIECAGSELDRRRSVEGIATFKFSDEAFKQFTEHAITCVIDSLSLPFAHWSARERSLVRVGSNLVFPEFISLYQQVIDKEGDFTAGSPLSPIGKVFFLNVLLGFMQGIQGLQICEITGDLLCIWQFYLELMGGKISFDVQFARDNLEQLARACYALKFVKARDDITADLTQKIGQLERDIPEDKPKIVALKEQYRRAKQSAFVKQCLAEASALKWKNAGEFLGMDQEE